MPQLSHLRTFFICNAIASQFWFLFQQFNHYELYQKQQQPPQPQPQWSTSGQNATNVNNNDGFYYNPASLMTMWKQPSHQQRVRATTTTTTMTTTTSIEAKIPLTIIDSPILNNNNTSEEEQNNAQIDTANKTIFIPFNKDVSLDIFTDEEKKLLSQVKVPESFVTKDNSYGACLLVMDSNHLMTEWIAYHYFALPLRALVVAVDPKSRLSPPSSLILKKWRPFIEIVEWHQDEDFAPECLHMKQQMNRYLCRQQTFYRSCAKELKQRNITYAVYQDVDEFVTLETEVFQNIKIQQQVDPKKNNNATTIELSEMEVRMKQVGHIRKLLLELEADPTLHPTVNHHYVNSTCFTYPRTLFISKESSLEELQENVPPSVFDKIMSLNTLRFRYRTPKYQSHGKGMIRLDHLPDDAFDTTTIMQHDNNYRRFNVHQPYETCYRYVGKTVLRANHYVGSLEAATFRDQYDPRNLTGRFLKLQDAERNHYHYWNDGQFRKWVQAFYQWQTPAEVADYLLLRDTGLSVYQKEDATLSML